MTPPSRAAAQAGGDPGNSGNPGGSSGGNASNAGHRKRPGMHDVARLAGVSHQTVSRVLNGSDGVSSRTRAVVLAAIEELGYRPNSAARTLVTGRSKVLGLVTIGGALYGPMSMLYGVESAAREEGYILTVANVGGGEGGSVERAVNRLEHQGVEGIIVVAPLTSVGESLESMARHLPLVAIESSVGHGMPVIAVDQSAGARLATEHLLGLGHATVWHVAGPTHWYEAQDRITGWTTALREAGVDVPPLLHGDWSASTGYDAGQILSRMPDVSAVFVANDSMAVGVLRALRENGRDLPGDISVVGFDDIPEAGYFSPPLTTVRQPFEEVGRRSLKALLAQIGSGDADHGRVVIAPELVVRESTAPPRH
ncbi:LacI family DNA-binding transcriptional regulator [Kineosporia sp. J2-2]|uniref:LacI family DNA-binding transcriptional regulator n=1 Tax=Kineosporia corallincola TaxID=2835133 RepID=A0ABS5THS1_9ACTN|nr:LacI family DNA-binding transcriptional regulator [Kineosporia corallincola]MBT0770641.1 LacI family DNA-binding transcriptional regulator [Kineosporia corallincola]